MDKKTDERILEYNAVFKENDDIYRAAAKCFGLSDCVLWILYILRVQPREYTQRELCEQLFMPKQTINSALKKLEAEGIIELRMNGSRKNKLVLLTEKGEALARKSADKLIAAETGAFSKLSEIEQKNFLMLFKKFTDMLRGEAARF